MRLSSTAVRNAREPGSKSIKMVEGAGLYREVKPTGRKLWRPKCRHLGNEKLISLGAYPEVSPKDATRLGDGHLLDALQFGLRDEFARNGGKIRHGG